MRLTDLNLISDAAGAFKIDERLLAALIYVESGYDQYAVRYEPGYEWIYNTEYYARRCKCTLETMVAIQSTSWGLCQVMGAHYYENGGMGFCTELMEPETNLELACIILRRHMRKYEDPTYIYAAYNAGGARLKNGKFKNQENVDKFIKLYNVLDPITPTFSIRQRLDAL